MTLRIPPSFGPPSAVFGGTSKDDNLSSGINASYPILRIKGKVWSITRGGNDPQVLMRADGDGPRNSVEVVVLAASQYVSKVFYEHGYEEGSTNPPDCFSPNGIAPDAGSAKRQHATCAGCPQNAWGSRITPSGKQGKACADSKRVAVSPLHDIRNEAMGGPMLLRVPGASLNDFANYGRQMKAMGNDYFAAGTKLSFDPGEAYPKLVLEPIRPLVDEEARAVVEARAGDQVKAILAEGSEVTQEPPPGLKLPPAFTQPVPPPVQGVPPQYVSPQYVPPAPPPPVAPQYVAPAAPPPVAPQYVAPAAPPPPVATPYPAAPPPPSPPPESWGLPAAAVQAHPVVKPVKPAVVKPVATPMAPPPPPMASNITPDFEASLDADLDNLLSE
jgi:hypothetical protein